MYRSASGEGSARLMRLGFLVSHRGSNFEAIFQACVAGEIAAEPVVLLSNNAQSQALEKAARAGLHAVHLSRKELANPQEYDAAMCSVLQEQEVDLVVLAGFMQKIGPQVLRAFRHRIVNIHPSLLPKYGGQGMYGMRVHQAVLDAGDTKSGATIHLIDEEYDSGPILAQKEVLVEEGETAESLATKVLAVEHQLYVDVLKRICDGSLPLESFSSA